MLNTARSPMMALDSRQTLPPGAFWYVGLRSLPAALLFSLIGLLFHLGAHSPHFSCRGLLCGKLSGDDVAALLWMLAAFVVLHAYLRFKAFSFVLTDKSMSIDSGVFFRSSSTFRYDRIQDIDTYQGPLRLMMGLKTVAIWTSSPDQFAGNLRRADGQILLTVSQADWLKDYLAEASAGGARSNAGGARQPGTFVNQPNIPITVAVLGFVVIAAAVITWLRDQVPMTQVPMTMAPAASDVGSVAAASPGARSPDTTTAPAGGQHKHVHVVRESNAGGQAYREAYSIACAIRDSGGTAADVRPCLNLAEAQRCEHAADFPSLPTAEPVQLTLVNRSGESVNFYWLTPRGSRSLYASLPPGGHITQASHVGAHWMVSAQDGGCVGIFDAATMTIGVF